ncbi:hypothetical protein MMPV_007463 [Pyropia vietnamensis]
MVGMAAVADVVLEWCVMCNGQPVPAAMSAIEDIVALPHPPCPADHLPSTVSWLRRATYLRTAVLIDDAVVTRGDGDDDEHTDDGDDHAAASAGTDADASHADAATTTPSAGVTPPRAAVSPMERSRVWQTIGAELAGAPLGSLSVVGARAAAALGGLAAAIRAEGGPPAAPPVQRLHLLAGAYGGSDRETGEAAAADLGAAAAAVAPTLEWLGVDAQRGWPTGGLCVALTAAGPLRSLRHMDLRVARGGGEVVDAATAAAVAAAAPRLSSLVVDAAVALDWGRAWSLAEGALPRLTVLDLTLTRAEGDPVDGSSGGDDAAALDEVVGGLAPLLAGRALDALALRLPSLAAPPSSSSPSVGNAVVDALLGGASLPTTLDLTGVPLSASALARLADDPRTAVDVTSAAVAVPVGDLPGDTMAALGPMSSLTALTLVLTTAAAADGGYDPLPVAPWVGLPALASLAVTVTAPPSVRVLGDMAGLGGGGNEGGDGGGVGGGGASAGLLAAAAVESASAAVAGLPPLAWAAAAAAPPVGAPAARSALTHVALSAPTPLSAWDAEALAPLAAGRRRAAEVSASAALLHAEVADMLPGVAVTVGVS